MSTQTRTSHPHTHTHTFNLTLLLLPNKPNHPPLRHLRNLLRQHLEPEPTRNQPGLLQQVPAPVPHQLHQRERLRPVLLAPARADLAQQLQDQHVHLELEPRELRRLLLGRGRVVHEVRLQRVQDRGAGPGLLVGAGGGVGGGGGGGEGRGDRDGEGEVGEERARIDRGVQVEALEDEAVELVLGDADGPVSLVAPAALFALQQIRVQQGHPGRAAGVAPPAQDKEDAGAIVETRVARVGEEDVGDARGGVVDGRGFRLGGQRDEVVVLEEVVALERVDRVPQLAGRVRRRGAVGADEEVVPERRHGDHGRGFRPPDPHGRAAVRVEADVRPICRDGDKRLAQRQRQRFLPIR